MKMVMESVSLVILNVKNVLNKLITVTLVLVTESKFQYVTVQPELFKILKKKSVHHVMNTVLLVWEPQKIVYNVLIPDITLQSVHLFHNGPNLLKLLISQSVLPLLSLVKLNVSLVPTPLDIVKLVMKTDLTLHFVHVMMDIMKTLTKSVKNVQSNVHIVLTQLLVSLVLLTELVYQPVTVLPVPSKLKDKQNVQIVCSLVLNVLVMLTIVLFVKPEESTHQNVTAQMVIMLMLKLTYLVLTVTIDVPLVLMMMKTVSFVPLPE